MEDQNHNEMKREDFDDLDENRENPEAELIEEVELEISIVEKVDFDDFADLEESEADEPEGDDAEPATGEPAGLEEVAAEVPEALESDGAPDAERDTAALARDIEAILFISPEPVTLETLAEVAGAEGEDLAHAVEAVREKYSDEEGGIVFAGVAGGYTLRTGDLARGAVERFCQRPVDYSLSPAAMETLAIIAYMQPVTRPEIARIRGVGADTVVNTLTDKGLLMEAGRHDETGAIRYRTTPVFEKLFGLPDLATLPSIEGFEATPEDVEELREKLHLAAEKRA